MHRIALAVQTSPFAVVQPSTSWLYATLLPVPHPSNLGMPHLLLKLEDTEH